MKYLGKVVILCADQKECSFRTRMLGLLLTPPAKNASLLQILRQAIIFVRLP